MTDQQIEKIWKEFADIPVDAEDMIETNFHIWQAGEDKQLIWEWFDEHHSKGLAWLMYGDEGIIEAHREEIAERVKDGYIEGQTSDGLCAWSIVINVL